jgi:glycosyltransferase involved in cell wall biosynthesis
LTQRRPWLKALSMALVERPILRHAAAVHFTSEAEAMEARKLGIAWREAIIPLGAPAAQRPADAGPFEPLRGGPCVLYLSRLDPKKNLEGLLHACALLVAEFPGLRLLVAGDGPAAYVQELKALADRLGLAQHMVWAGHLQGLQKSQAFAVAELFVLPSFSENFGIAAAEALAAGLPCVLAEGVAIAKEVAQAGAGSCVAPTPQALAAGLRRIMAEPQARAAMSANAQRLAADRYSVNAMGQALRQLYCELVRQ